MQEIQDQVRILVKLNGLDRGRYLCRQELTETPAGLARQAEELEAQVAVRDGTQAQLDSARGQLTRGEDDLAKLESRRDKARERMPFLRTSTQIEATQRETAALGEEIDSLEGSLLELMEQIELLQDQVLSESRRVDDGISALADAKDVWTGRKAELEVENARLDAERAAIEGDLRVDFLRRYQLAWRQRGRVDPSGLTGVDGRICSTCHTEISARWIQESRDYASVHSCDSCKRLLLFDPDAAPESVEAELSPQ